MGLITDGLDPKLGLLELLQDGPFSLGEGILVVLQHLRVLLPHLHLLLVKNGPVLVEVLQFFLGLIEILLQLVDLALLLPFLDQIPTDLFL